MTSNNDAETQFKAYDPVRDVLFIDPFNPRLDPWVPLSTIQFLTTAPVKTVVSWDDWDDYEFTVDCD